MTTPDLRVLSLGAGVQSTTLYLMAVEGAVGPKPDVAIFADTCAEPPWVYQHLDWLERGFGDSIPIRRVSAGDLVADVLRSRDGRSRFASLPLYVRSKDGGRASMLRRQCTREYKIDPINREIRRLLGITTGQRAAGRYDVEEWIGISLDEVQRCKPSRHRWITTRWPLVAELQIRRHQCTGWLAERGYPEPRRSSCVICPFHDDRFWAWLKKNHPGQFGRAAAFDREVRKGKLRCVNEDAYLHRSLLPLDEIDFGEDTSNQLELAFGNECEGVCGV